jgi:hypothetical protein
MYKDNIIKILTKTGIGFVLMFVVMTQIDSTGNIKTWSAMALFLAAIPYGWSLINKHFGCIIVFDGAAFVFGIVIKILLSFLIGWIAVPVGLIWNTIMYILEKRKLNSSTLSE